MDLFILNELANEYGYSVLSDGKIIITQSGKETGVTIKFVKKKLHMVTDSDKLLFSGANKPKALENFLKSYWYATKI